MNLPALHPETLRLVAFLGLLGLFVVRLDGVVAAGAEREREWQRGQEREREAILRRHPSWPIRCGGRPPKQQPSLPRSPPLRRDPGSAGPP